MIENPAFAHFRAENAAKNREELTLLEFGGWGKNKDFWPEYSPLIVEALSLVMGTFYVFNMEYPAVLKKSLTLLQKTVLLKKERLMQEDNEGHQPHIKNESGE